MENTKHLHSSPFYCTFDIFGIFDSGDIIVEFDGHPVRFGVIESNVKRDTKYDGFRSKVKCMPLTQVSSYNAD